jgi:hypothetical protein
MYSNYRQYPQRGKKEKKLTPKINGRISPRPNNTIIITTIMKHTAKMRDGNIETMEQVVL